MPKICINPCSLSAEDASWLPAFFNSQSEQNFWPREVEYSFKDHVFFFEYSLVRRACHDAARGVRYEVVDDRGSLVGEGGCGKVLPIIGTLCINDEGLFRFKTPETDPKHKPPRVSKMQLHTETTKNPQELATNEYHFTDIVAPLLSMKQPSFFRQSEYFRMSDYTMSSCLVMRRQPGRDLYDVIGAEYSPLPPILTSKQRFALTKALIEAFGEIARKGVVHGDIKPENVMIDMRTNPPIVRVIDLALARVDGLTEERRSGTRCYTAPELLVRRGAPVTRTTKMDVFSLRLVLALVWRSDFMMVLAREKYPLIDSSLILGALFTGITDLSNDEKRSIHDLLTEMLHLDSHKRISFEEALKRPVPTMATSTAGTSVADVPAFCKVVVTFFINSCCN